MKEHSNSLFAFQVKEISYVIDFEFMRLYTIHQTYYGTQIGLEFKINQEWSDRIIMGNYLYELSPLLFKLIKT